MTDEHSTRVNRTTVLKRMAHLAFEKLFLWALVSLAFVLGAVAIYLVGIPARELALVAGLTDEAASLHVDRFVFGLSTWWVTGLIGLTVLGNRGDFRNFRSVGSLSTFGALVN